MPGIPGSTIQRGPPMKIAVVHSFYRRQLPSGENEIVEQQVRALDHRGHEVLLVAQQSADHAGPVAQVALGVRVATHSGFDPTSLLREFRPDIVHVHNLFPQFSCGWVRDWPGPIVATLHNYRPFCAKATIFRDGEQCLDCLDHPWAAVKYACYRDSRIATAPLAWRNRRGVSGDPLLQRADHVIYLSERSRMIYKRAGLVARADSVIPNGLSVISPVLDDRPREGWLFVGRLSPEKGVLEMLAHWPFARQALTVVGDGPLRDEIVARFEPQAGFTAAGSLSRDQVDDLLRRSVGCVIPSRWAEGLPLVLGEAMRAGTPVLARTGSSAADFVMEFGGGSAYSSDSALPAVVTGWDPTEYNPLEAFQQHLSEPAWVSALERLYRGLT